MKRLKAIYKSVKAHIDEFEPAVMSVYASSTTFFILLSIFPFAIVLISLLQYLPFDENLLSFLNLQFVPEDIKNVLMSIVDGIVHDTSSAILPIASIGTLWSASTGIYSLSKGFNKVYRRKETRNYFFVRFLCLLYTVAFLVLLILVLGFLVFGNDLIAWLSDAFPSIRGQFFTSTFFRGTVTFLLLTFFFTLFYKTVPNRSRKTRWFGEIAGAVFASVGWMVFSSLYSLYIMYFSNYANVYGSLTAVIFMLIWLYACIYILLIGAHVNVLIRRHKRFGTYVTKTKGQNGEEPQRDRR